MPLHETQHEKQIEFIKSLMEDYIDLSAADLDTLKVKIAALNTLCIEAANRNHTLPIRERNADETLDQYQLYLIIANPCGQFLGLETQGNDATFRVEDVQTTIIEHIDTFVFTELMTHYIPLEVMPENWLIGTPWEKDKINFALTNNSTNKEVFKSQNFISDPYVANNYNLDLPKFGDMYEAKIVQSEISGFDTVTENNEERIVPWVYPILNLDINVHLPFSTLPKKLENFIDFPQKETAEEIEAERIRITRVAMVRAEKEVAKILLLFLDYDPESYRNADALLTYRYYFEGIYNETISEDALDNMQPAEIYNLRSRSVISLLQNNIFDISTARQLSQALLGLLEVPYYHNAIIEKKITFESLSQVTDEQIKILRLPSIVNLQTRNAQITFDFVKNISQAAAQLLADSNYFERSANNRIDIAALQKITEIQKDALLSTDIMQVLFNDPTGQVLKLVLDANFTYLYSNEKEWLSQLKELSSQQINNLLLFGITYLMALSKLTLGTLLAAPQWKIEFISSHSPLIWSGQISLEQCLFINESTAREFNSNKTATYQIINNDNYDRNHIHSLALITWAVHFYIRLDQPCDNPLMPVDEDKIQLIKMDFCDICATIPTDNEISAQEILLSEIMRLFLKKMVHDAKNNHAHGLDNVIDIIEEAITKDLDPAAEPRHRRWKDVFDIVIGMTTEAPSCPDSNSAPEKRLRGYSRFFSSAENNVAPIFISRPITALNILSQSLASTDDITQDEIHQAKRARV